MCKHCGLSHYFVLCCSCHALLIGGQCLLEGSVYWRVVFISVDLAVGEAFIGGRHLLEGGV